ncbi:hypothetical protein EDB19DRAFT_1896940 [Suillus lakei]|nr:hypothetical protein EDB19DRAFT_1896940 [Suillus lakei]
MTLEQCQALQALVERHDGADDDTSMDFSLDFNEILRGDQQLEISHSGRELEDLAQEIMVQHCVDTFDAQLPVIMEAYLEWSLQRVQSAEKVTLTLKATNSFITSALIRQGVIPCSLISPSVAVTVDALELKVEYCCYLSCQLTIVFDLYLQVHTSVDALVAEVLNRNTPDWCLKHACPSCTYTLVDEEQLTFKFLYAMDGNDSLKRILRQTLGVDDEDTQSSELPTTQQVRGDRYLPCNYVNSWGNGRQEEANTTIGTNDTLLDTFGSNLGGGYDIRCQFKTTLNNSSLGIEDLETCERIFLKSNALASTMCYASIFHHQQGITNYFEHNDDYEVHANLCTYFTLNHTKESTFNEWLKEEKVYLQGLCTEPKLEMLQMEYWQKLVNLSTSKNELDTASSTSTPSNAHSLASNKSATRRLEMTRRHALENFEKDLGVYTNWQNAGCLIANQKYQCSLDQLEGLIVAWIFELTKMNRSGTGCKMCKHITKALQTCSMAIRNALNHYNATAHALSPPRRMLKWEEVVEYAFLADFNLLPMPAAHQATDLYFKHSEAFSPALAHQISLWQQARGRFNFHHIKHLQDIARLPGFPGTIVSGVCVLRGTGEKSTDDLDNDKEELMDMEEAAESPTERSAYHHGLMSWLEWVGRTYLLLL